MRLFKRTVILGLMALLAGASPAVAARKPQAAPTQAPLAQGEMWLDTDGNRLNAHGAGMLYHNGTYYLYGEYKVGKTVLPEWATWECYRTDVTGISCYSSKDLRNWKFEGVVLPAEEDPSSDLHKSKVLERPKVVYNPKTGKFVMWAHVESADYGKAAAGVAVADSPVGPFKYLGSFRPNNAMSRDQTVFVDDDGKAYQFASSENNQTMYINELTDDYLRPTGRFTRNFIGDAREAPAVFKRNGKYYVLTSGCTGWDPNHAQVAVADSIMGPWTVLGDPCTGPDADKTFYAQSTYVQPIAGKEDCYLAMFDRWNKKDLEDSRYVWLPVKWEGDKPVIPWEETVSVAQYPDKSRFEAGDGTFLLNGEPFVVKAAELHYPRIPKEYWDHRIKMAKALGMNTICLYTFWNAHEPKPDQFDFEGQNDLRQFIKLCQANDMKVILRPGPYVCAEWEMGGLPWWLLQKKDIRLRENDPYFLERVDKFQKAVADQVGDLTIANGGPIIMVQVENEYGSYGIDKPYVANIRDMLRKNFGQDVTLFQCDWSSNFLNNGLENLVWTMNFGTGANIDQQFAKLKEVRPDSPLMCSEFWSGWFDKWGANHETRPAKDMIAGIDEMLSKDISFSLYMTHGGTSFGHWAGANSPGFAPDVTSYDYDAPINEQGAATPKYHALREAMAKYTPGKQAPMPKAIPTISIPAFELTQCAPLFSNLPEGKKDTDIKTMEEYDQGYGSILYRTTLPAVPEGSVLTVSDAHDYAQVFVDGNYIGKLDRRMGEKELMLPACSKGAVLDILVEAMGRINFGRAIKDFKGITDKVTVTEQRDGHDYVCDLKDWTVFPLPDELAFYENMVANGVNPAVAKAPGERMPVGVYKGTFKVSKPGDTFLNMEQFGKGLVYVNGHALGRFWEIGPQQTLYLPGPWLKKGDNEIVVFDVVGPKEAKAEGLKTPIWDKLPYKNRKSNGTAPKLDEMMPVLTAEFEKGNGWKQADFGKAVKGRYLILEAVDGWNSGDEASIAELYVLDNKGERLPREGWVADYVSSENTEGVNRTGDKIFDLQESTYWQSKPGVKFPHVVVIDLGRPVSATAIQYLPRMETGAPGSIRKFKVYMK